MRVDVSAGSCQADCYLDFQPVDFEETRLIFTTEGAERGHRQQKIWGGVARAVLRYLAVLSLQSLRERPCRKHTFYTGTELCCLSWTWPYSSKSIQSAGAEAKDDKLVSVPKVYKRTLKGLQAFFLIPQIVGAFHYLVLSAFLAVKLL